MGRDPSFFDRLRSATRASVLQGLAGLAALGISTGTMGATASAPGGGIEERSLATRPGTKGGPLFTVVRPEESGLTSENNYDDPEMWGKRARELEIGAIGTGVAIGDFDGDGIGIQPVGVTIAVESERRNDGDNSFVEQVPEHFGIYLVNFAGVLLVDAFENAERDGFDGVGLRGAEIVRGKSL